jgi:MFS family permease
MAAGMMIVGLAGLLGLTLCSWLADKIHQRWQTGRLMFAARSMLIAALATGYALLAVRIESAVFVALFSIGWLFAYNFATCVYTAIQDVIKPRLRATAMALFFAGLSLLGGGLGPVAVGMLSDHYAPAALLAAGASEMNEPFKAVGLHNAMYPIPAALLLTMLALLPASRCFVPDAAQMQRGMTDDMPV